MKQLTLINGRQTSGFVFGTMQFGGGADADASQAMFNASRAAGITHFDTAVGYTDGNSARILGQLAEPIRDQVYIATKVGSKGGCGRANILAQWDMCKAQLKMDAVDLLYLHRWDDDTPLIETFETMAALQASGAIRHIGVSNYAAWQVMKAQAVCASLGTKIDAIQPMYNLVKRQAEVELMPMAADQDMAIIPYSPLGGGLLTGKYSGGGTGRLTQDARYGARYGPQHMHDTATALTQLANELGSHPATLAAAWAAAHKTQPQPILSARTAEQLTPSLAAISFDMTAEIYAKISALAPSPPPATDRLEENT